MTAATDELVQFLSDARKDDRLEEKEIGFVCSLRQRAKPLSAKQLAWAETIRDRVRTDAADPLVEPEGEELPVATPPPAPPFLDQELEAESWAAVCDEQEAARYCWALARRLPLERRAGLAGLILRELADQSPPEFQGTLTRAAAVLRQNIGASNA